MSRLPAHATARRQLVPTILVLATVCALGMLSDGLVRPPPAQARDAELPPREGRIRIETPRGGQTRERIVTVTGRVENVPAKRLTLVLNGVPLSIERKGDRFASEQVLAPGWNGVRVEARVGDQVIADEIAVYASVPRKDLRVTLTWDVANCDVDLWVTGPDDEKISYQQKQGEAGGTLDIDVTTGFGPETYTHAKAPKGSYRIQAHCYRAPPSGITPFQVTTVLYEGTPRERRRVMRGVLLATGEVLEVGEVSVP